MVQYITYKEKEYPIKVGYLALKRLKQETNKELQDITDSDFEIYEALLFFALEQGARVMEQKMVFERTQMEEVLDECFFDFVKKIPLFFPTAEEGEGKKKSGTAKQ